MGSTLWRKREAGTWRLFVLMKTGNKAEVPELLHRRRDADAVTSSYDHCVVQKELGAYGRSERPQALTTVSCKLTDFDGMP